MYFAQQAVGEREASAQPGQAVFEGGDVVRDLNDVVEGYARRLDATIEANLKTLGYTINE